MRLIDADALLIEFQKAQDTMYRHGREYSYSFLNRAQEISTEWYAVEYMVENAPTIEERKTGKWILDTIYPSGIKKYRCPYCGEEYTVYEKYEGVFRKKYCYNCGARMEGEEE